MVVTSFPPSSNCSTVLMYGQKHDLNNYLATRPTAPVHTLADIIAFNNAHAAVALKYGQAIFLAADQLDTNPGSADTLRYLADRAQDLALTRTGLDAVFNGPDGIEGTDDDFDAILFPQNRGAAAPAKAGYPSIVVPGGFVPPTGAVINPAPFGVTSLDVIAPRGSRTKETTRWPASAWARPAWWTGPQRTEQNWKAFSLFQATIRRARSIRSSFFPTAVRKPTIRSEAQ